MTTFTELPLSSALQRKLAAAQFINLTPIQARAIAPALEGKDVIGTSQTGTGKTLAFLIPIIEMLQSEPSRQTRALVLLPTRELAMQVHEQYENLRSKSAPRAGLVIGGVSETDQIKGLRSGPGLIIATPGRLQDFITRKLVDLRQIKILVLDEADRMLDMGFLPAIQRILTVLPANRQTLFFTRTKRGTQRLAKELVRDGFNAAMIHGDRTQGQRTAALNGFQEGRFQVLVATDIASRGLHVDEVAHVINYDLPKMAEDFIHRVGRTGRAGLQGRASTLVAGAEVLELRHIERTLQLRMERTQVDPSVEQPKRFVENTLASRTLTALPGEVFV